MNQDGVELIASLGNSEPLDLRGLLALRQCAESGSVSAAARALGWSHPTVDHHLTKLERFFDTKLLARTSRGSRPTAVGEMVVERAAEILGLCDRLRTDIRDAEHSNRTVVRFAALPSIGSLLLPALQRDLKASDTAVDLQVTFAELDAIATALDQGQVDIAIVVSTGRIPPLFNPSVKLELLHAEALHLCMAADHPLAARYPNELPPLQSLRDEQWAMGISEQDPTDTGFKELFAEAGIPLHVGMRLDDYTAVQRLVGAGMISSLVPQSALEPSDAMHTWRLPLDLLRREVLCAVRVPEGSSRDPVTQHHRAVGEVARRVRDAANALFPPPTDSASRA